MHTDGRMGENNLANEYCQNPTCYWKLGTDFRVNVLGTPKSLNVDEASCIIFTLPGLLQKNEFYSILCLYSATSHETNHPI